jgi:hypothetical protein
VKQSGTSRKPHIIDSEHVEHAKRLRVFYTVDRSHPQARRDTDFDIETTVDGRMQMTD